MSETITGVLESIEIKNKGTKKDSGEKWTLYSYKISGKYYSGFIDATEQLKHKVTVEYTEKDNPNGQYPYKNVSKITDMGEATKEESKKAESETKSHIGDMGAMFGMTINQTMEQLRESRKMMTEQKKGLPPFEDHFDEIFDKLWVKFKDKRKQVLGGYK